MEFTKGQLIYTFEIYYASRDSLINMGVPIFNQEQHIPQAFPGKYCQPPKMVVE